MNDDKKLTLKGKIGYGLGDAGGCLTFVLMGSIFTKYCTDALGVNATLLGILWIVWNVAAAASFVLQTDLLFRPIN